MSYYRSDDPSRTPVLPPRGFPPSRFNRFLLVVVVALTVWLFWERRRPAPLLNPQVAARAVTPRGDLESDERRTIDLFKNVSPSVVYIRNIALVRHVYSRNVFRVPRGAGSGFIYSADGYVVTNYHVILDASEVVVTLYDRSEWSARVVGKVPFKDLAVLKIDAPAEKLLPIPLGTSSDLQVGQKVYAIGNPFGLDFTLTTGVVSALGREIESIVTNRTIQDVIQTDAAINPGNSGGPLLDSAGRLIGVTTQIASPSGASAGIGFAVPADIVTKYVPQLIKHGRIVRPGLGVYMFDESVTQRMRMKGLLIREVRSGGAAERAGLRGTILDDDGELVRLGDILLKIDDHEILGSNDLFNTLEQYDAGDSIKITYLRNDEPQVATVTLQPLDE